MKKMKRTAAIAAAAVMAVSAMVATATITGSASATTAKSTVSIENAKARHTYYAYQVFKGTYSNGGILSNVTWGDSIDTSKLGDIVADIQADADLNALTGASALTASSSAQDFADVFATITSGKSTTDYTVADKLAAILSNYMSSSYASVDTHGVTTASFDVENGYYLFVDTSYDSFTTLSKHILAVEGDINITLKQGEVSLEKKVKDVNDKTGVTSDWQDAADMDIGDKVEFKLTGTLPQDYAVYDSYQYKFTDTFSDGLTFDETSVEVTAGTVTVDPAEYTITKTANGFELKFTDLKTAVPGLTSADKVVVTYKATLNANAQIGATGNPNTANLEYSNNPNKGGSGTAKTLDDKVIVFTYKTIVNKVDENGAPLKGANFTLSKNVNGSWVAVKEITELNKDAFEFTGLDAGDYKLEETKTPTPEYNKIDDILFTITADYDIDAADPKLNDLSANVTGGKASFNANATDGILTTDVENKKGSQLPETGGIGTKIFYATGASIALGAGVLLITKKRKKD